MLNKHIKRRERERSGKYRTIDIILVSLAICMRYGIKRAKSTKEIQLLRNRAIVL